MLRTKLLVAVTVPGVIVAVLGWRMTQQQATQPHAVTAPARPTGGELLTLHGTVRGTDGRALPGATVCAKVATGSLLALTVRCERAGPEGSYVIAGLARAPHWITAAAEGREALTLGPVALPASRRAAVDFALRAPGAPLFGVVRDLTGAPLARATVQIEQAGAVPLATVVESDDQGRFQAFLPPGAVELIARAAGHAETYAYATAPQRSVDIALAPESVITGTVVDPAGAPVAGASVVAEMRFDGFRPPVEVRSGPDGGFRIEGLEAAPFALSAVAPGLRGELAQPVQVAHASVATGTRIALRRAAQVEGKVTLGSDAMPCERGAVSLGVPSAGALEQSQPSRHEAAIEEGGRVRFDAVPPGRYAVTVRCVDHVWRDGPELLEVGDEDLRGLSWRVAPGAKLALHVVDARGEPVPYAEGLLLHPSHEGASTLAMPIRADAQGTFLSEGGLLPGRYRFALGRQVPESTEVDVGNEPGTVAVTARVSASGAIVVHVVDAAGHDVDGLHVRAVSSATPRDGKARGGDSSARSLGDGRYWIASLPQGAYRVMMEDGLNLLADTRESTEAVEVGAHGVVALRRVLDRSASVGGQVLDPSGAPAAQVWVSIQPVAAERGRVRRLPFGVRARVLSDAEGRFRFDTLLPGARFSVRVQRPDGRTVRAKQDVEAGASLLLRMADTET